MPLHTNTTPDKFTHVSGKEYLFFSGFSYLGLHAHPHFKEALRSGIDLYGTVFVSSRIANLRLDIYNELEEALAGMLQQPAAAAFSSGYLASQAAAQYAATQGELCYAPQTHVSLHTGKHLIPTLSWEEWTAQTIEKVNAWPDHTFVIVADSVNPLTATVNDFSWLSALNREVLVLIDDSHGFGVTDTIATLPPGRYLISSSLAKAYSTQGGVVAGQSADIQALKKMPAFTAGTPMMPASAYAFLQSRSLHPHQQALARKRIAQFAAMTADIDALYNPFHLPVFLLKGQPGIEQVLQEQGIIISSFGYPDPDSAPVNRIIITALHQTAQLETLRQALSSIKSS